MILVQKLILVVAMAGFAEAADLWSLQPVRRPDAPRVTESGVVNDVDRFIRARLAQQGLRASPEAQKAVLLRRLSLDLIGLPPTPAELAAFLGDTKPDAWSRQVERLLRSDGYGRG